MIRSLVTAVIEYLLAGLVLYKGKYHKKLIFSIIILLATYQLGELIVFATKYDFLGFRIAYFATTLLPPLGLLLVERITQKKYGYILFQVVAGIFAILFFVNPEVILNYSVGNSCIAVHSYSERWPDVWSYFYALTLVYTLVVCLVNIRLNWRAESREAVKMKIRLGLVSISYSLFYVVSLAVINLKPEMRPALASLMCALAAFTALILTGLSITHT